MKEKYEIHHNVRIQDNAIISAAVLSERYITSRFLPDKAIDLIDEASSRLKMQLESQPEEIDILERKILQLEIEETGACQGKRRGIAEKIKRAGPRVDNEIQKDAMKLQWNKRSRLWNRSEIESELEN